MSDPGARGGRLSYLSCMPDPHPKSPEWRVIEHALERRYLSQQQLQQARSLAGNHPGQQDAALLRVIVQRFTRPEHVDLLRAYYEEQKETFKREAAEAELEVLSISDILVRPVLELDPDSGRFRQIPKEVAIAESGSGSDMAPVPASARKWSASDAPAKPVKPAKPAKPAAPRPSWDEDHDAAPMVVPEAFKTPAPQPAVKLPEPEEEEPEPVEAHTSRRSKRPSVASVGGGGGGGLSPVKIAALVVVGILTAISFVYVYVL